MGGIGIGLGIGLLRGGGAVDNRVLYDTFAGADGTNLTAHTPDINTTGGSWSAYSGTITLSGNRAAGSGVYAIDCGEANVELTCTVRLNAIGYAGVMLRGTNASNYVYCLVRYTGAENGHIDIFTRQSGSLVVLNETIIPISQGVDYNLTVVANEESITLTLGDYEAFAASPFNQSATIVGLWSNIAASWDNMAVSPAEAANYIRLTDSPVGVGQHGFEELNGLLYSVAGTEANNIGNQCTAYNPATATWTSKADLPVSLQSGILRAVGGKLYHIGGYNPNTQTYYGNVYEYDPATDGWTEKTAMPTPREDFGSAVVDDKIYCFGGLSGAGDTKTKAMEVYDPATDTWDTTKADMPDYKWSGDFGAACNGKIYAVGGSNTFVGYPNLTPVADVYEYDPATDTWTAKADMPMPRCYKEVAVVGTKLFVVGGSLTDQTDPTATIYEYDTATDTWTRRFDLPYAITQGALAAHDGKVYLSGGGTYGEIFNNNRLWRLNL